jgi:hypothetical protein
MNSFQTEALAKKLEFNQHNLILYLKDGRILSVPLVWFPRLVHAEPKQLQCYEIMGDGEGIHWPALDEDLSTQGLLLGQAKNAA